MALQLLYKVAAPGGRLDLSLVASGYSDSGIALGIRHLQQEHGWPWAGEAALHQIDAPGSAE